MSLAGLRALAEAATPGLWRPDRQGGPVALIYGTNDDDVARFFAACSPDVIKALVAVAEAAEAVDDAIYYNDITDKYDIDHADADDRHGLTSALDALRAVLG